MKASLEMSSENVLNTFDINEKDFKTKTAFIFTKHECWSIQQCKVCQAVTLDREVQVTGFSLPAHSIFVYL